MNASKGGGIWVFQSLDVMRKVRIDCKPLSTYAGDDREDQVQWRRTPLSTFFYLNLMLINMLTSYRGHMRVFSRLTCCDRGHNFDRLSSLHFTHHLLLHSTADYLSFSNASTREGSVSCLNAMNVKVRINLKRLFDPLVQGTTEKIRSNEEKLHYLHFFIWISCW